MNSERDPKKYPKVGDVLTRFGTIRHVTGVATNVRGTLIRVFFDGGDPGDRTCSVSIGAWRGWTQDDCQVLLRDETSDEGETPQMLIATHRCGGLVASSWLDDGFDEVNRRLGHDWHAKGYLVSKISVPDGTPMMRWCECNRQGQQDIGDKSTCTCGPVRHWECNAGCKAKHSAEAVAVQVAVPVISAEKFPPLDRSWSANTEHIAGWNDCRNTMLAAAPEASQPVLDRPASIGGTTFGVGVSVRTLVAAAQRRYEAEQTPASQAERQALIDALRRPVVDAEIATLRSAIRDMALLLRSREWADQFNTDHDVTDLEVQITELVGTATKLREQNAALVAAMQNIADEFVPGDEQKLYGTPTDVLDRIRSTAWAALTSAKGGAQ